MTLDLAAHCYLLSHTRHLVSTKLCIPFIFFFSGFKCISQTTRKFKKTENKDGRSQRTDIRSQCTSQGKLTCDPLTWELTLCVLRFYWLMNYRLIILYEGVLLVYTTYRVFKQKVSLMSVVFGAGRMGLFKGQGVGRDRHSTTPQM